MHFVLQDMEESTDLEDTILDCWGTLYLHPGSLCGAN